MTLNNDSVTGRGGGGMRPRTRGGAVGGGRLRQARAAGLRGREAASAAMGGLARSRGRARQRRR